MSSSAARLLRAITGDEVLRGVGWLGLAEMIARISRLATAVIVARLLTPIDLGVAAIAITCFEMARAFAGSGLGHMVVRATAERLVATSAAASRAAWQVCMALALVQGVAGALIAAHTGRLDLLFMVGCLAGVFLLMPLGLMSC